MWIWIFKIVIWHVPRFGSVSSAAYRFWFKYLEYSLRTTTVVLEFRLMALHELTFAFVFGHVRIYAWPFCMHFTEFCENIFIQYRYISILLNSIWPPNAMLDLLGKVVRSPKRPVDGGYPL